MFSLTGQGVESPRELLLCVSATCLENIPPPNNNKKTHFLRKDINNNENVVLLSDSPVPKKFPDLQLFLHHFAQKYSKASGLYFSPDP